MIKAVLLDLDNTLLHNPDEAFAREYLRLADEYFEERWQFPRMSAVLSQVMQAFRDKARKPSQTNAQIAAQIIAPVVSKSPHEVWEAFYDFVQTICGQLQSLTRPLGAFVPSLIEDLLQQKLAVVIATNPLYPAEAVRQWLNWAGISDDFRTYALVTHAENMHFIKPDPAYYAEIIAHVGVEPDEAIMLGDSMKNDIEPAQRVGLHTHHLDIANGYNSQHPLQQWHQSITATDWREPPDEPQLAPEMIEPEMRGNLAALFGTLNDVKPHYWNQHPDPNEWSPIQIICHLLESEWKVQRPRLERIKAEENPFLIAPPPPAGPRYAIPCDTDGLRVAEQFAAERAMTMNWLTTLDSVEWNRPARHSVFGPTSLLEMAHFTAQHDRLHINQICQTLGRCK